MTFPTTLVHASGRALTLDRSRLVLAFDPPGRPKALAHALKAAGLVPEDSPADPKRQVNQSPRYFFARALQGTVAAGTADKLMAALGKKTKATHLIWVGGVYRMAGTDTDRGLLAPVLDAVVARLRAPLSARTQKAFKALLDKTGLVVDAKRTKALGGAFVLRARDVRKRSVLESLTQLAELDSRLLVDAHPDYVPLMSPAAGVPTSETYWMSQWNMTQIGAASAWDVTTGDSTVYVCVIDRGIERAHEELNRATSLGYDVDSGLETSGIVPPAIDVTYPSAPSALDAGHGTALASITSGLWDSGGVAGLAGGASLFALSAPNWTALEVSTALERARNLALPPVGGAAKRVLLLGGISMAWTGTAVQTSLTNAFGDGLVVVCPSGDTDAAGIEYPGDGTHPEMLVCGASDQADERHVASYGPTLSLVAPGKDIPVADLTGTVGYSTIGDTSYHLLFEGSSAGAAHTAGLAALVLSAPGLDLTSYPGSNVRDKVLGVITRTCEKVGSIPYGTGINPRNDQMGVGRIRADHAVDFADVMIKDDPTDTGVEPSTGVFWRDSDVVARRDAETQAVVEANFDVWQPDPAQSRNIYVKPDLSDSYVYVRVQNLGPATATNVRVRAVGAACSTGFQYPTDWNAAEDATHLVMAPNPWPGDPAAVGDEYVVGTLAPGSTKIVRFSVSHTQAVKARDTWSGHACALAKVLADNDHAFNLFAPPSPVPGEQSRRNNLVQRNLHSVTATSPWFFPFFAGNAADPEEELELVVDARKVPAGTLLRLGIDEPERAFPRIDHAALSHRVATAAPAGPSFTLLNRARIKVSAGSAAGVLSLEPGSRFDYAATTSPQKVHAKGGAVTLVGDKRVVEIRQRQASVRLSKRPHQLLPMYLQIPVPPGTRPEERFHVDVIQKNGRGEVVGGFSLVLLP